MITNDEYEEYLWYFKKIKYYYLNNLILLLFLFIILIIFKSLTIFIVFELLVKNTYLYKLIILLNLTL